MGAALAYMIRRYGYTTHGSDDRKTLCRYVLPTSVEDFYLTVTMRGSHALVSWTAPAELWRHIHDCEPTQLWRSDMQSWAEEQGDPVWNQFSSEHYRHYLKQHTDKKFTDEWFAAECEAKRMPFKELYSQFGEYCDKAFKRMSQKYCEVVPFPDDDSAPLPDGHPLRPFEDAFKTALQDLLDPVYIRDVPRNILGRMLDEEVFDSEEIHGREATTAEYHVSAGYGVPVQFIENASKFHDVVAAIKRQGDGDFWRGVDKLGLLSGKDTAQGFDNLQISTQ